MNFNPMDYVKPEFIGLILAMVYIAYILESTQKVAKWAIPAILASVSVIFCTLWILSTEELSVGEAVFSGFVQGVIVALVAKVSSPLIGLLDKSKQSDAEGSSFDFMKNINLDEDAVAKILKNVKKENNDK